MRKRRFIRQLGIPVTEEIYQAIISICDKEEKSMAEYIREAIEAKLAQDTNHKPIKED
jgi:predicted DNA-binding protein